MNCNACHVICLTTIQYLEFFRTILLFFYQKRKTKDFCPQNCPIFEPIFFRKVYYQLNIIRPMCQKWKNCHRCNKMSLAWCVVTTNIANTRAQIDLHTSILIPVIYIDLDLDLTDVTRERFTHWEYMGVDGQFSRTRMWTHMRSHISAAGIHNDLDWCSIV